MLQIMKTKSFITQIALVAILVSCASSNGKLEEYIGVPHNDNSLKDLVISYSTWDDSEYGGDQAIAISLIMENKSSSSLDNCTLIINDRYHAALELIEYYYGFIKGNKPMDRNYIKAGEILELSFSHDNNNHIIFKDGKQFFPSEKRINELKIISKQGTGSWKFKKNSSKK